MASDPYTLERLRHHMHARGMHWEEKKMFGGDCFMVDGKMCFGTYQGGIMWRVHPDEGEALSKREGVTVMVQGGRSMHGYLQAAPEAYDRDEDLAFWIDKCLAYNPLAKASKKK
jgi:TfoX/Sxy family transcriptional regulator of competence genes